MTGSGIPANNRQCVQVYINKTIQELYLSFITKSQFHHVNYLIMVFFNSGGKTQVM